MATLISNHGLLSVINAIRIHPRLRAEPLSRLSPGKPGDRCGCPVALAFRDIDPAINVSPVECVTTNEDLAAAWSDIFVNPITTSGGFYRVEPSQAVHDWMAAYDRGRVQVAA